MTGEIETKDEDTDAGKLTTSWLRELSLSSAHEDKWRKRAKKVIERYRDEEANENRKSQFNILYSNTEVLRGVIYQKSPTPDVRRRFLDRDPIGKDAAQILQRSLSYCADSYDFDGVMNAVVEDYLLPGRGLAKVKYVPTYAPMTNEAGEIVNDEAGEPIQQVIYETVETEYVEWDMVRISPAKRWSKVRWIAFGELLTRDELKSQFGDAGAQCTLDWAPSDKKDDDDEMFKRALVWSIWDKTSKKVYVVSKGSPGQPLAVKDDPLNLTGFFPCPSPIYAIQTTGSMIPIPEYTQYQDQAMELDNLTQRIDALTDALRRRGVYDASYPELEKLSSAGDNEFIAIENFTNLAEKGGLSAALYESPIETIAKVLLQLMQQREAVKQIIYEVTGIADVVRGVSEASETLGAQELKARYANSRTGPRQKAVQVFARDLYRLKAEIISEKFSPETLALMTGFDLAKDDVEKQSIQRRHQAIIQSGKQVPAPEKLNKPTWEQVVKLLRDDRLRGFRVDIETDSTVQPDAAQEQKNRVDLLTAITQFVQGIGPAVQSGAVPMPLAKELLTFGVRAFKVSPQLEDALDTIGQSGNNEADQAKQQVDMWKQQAVAEVQQQVESAKQIIEQAKEAKSAIEKESIKADAAKQIQDAQKSFAEREAALSAKEAQLDVDMKVNQAIETMKAIVEQFKAQLQQAQEKPEEKTESNDVDRIGMMHEQTMAAFESLVNRLVEGINMPRMLQIDPVTGQKMAVPVRTLQ